MNENENWQELNDGTFCRLWEAVSGFHHTAIGGEVVFGLDRVIPYDERRVARALFRKSLHDRALTFGHGGLCDMHENYWMWGA